MRVVAAFGALLVLLLVASSALALATQDDLATTQSLSQAQAAAVSTTVDLQADEEDEDELDEELEADEEEEDQHEEEDEEELDDEEETEEEEADAADQEGETEEEAMLETAVGAPLDLTGDGGVVRVKPGPPPTYSHSGYFYKMFAHNNKAGADNLKTAWDSAVQYHVPMPVYEVKEVRYIAHGAVNAADGWAFRTKACPGTFFQFSKAGHKARVIAWINTQTVKGKLRNLKALFENVAAHIGDGQGFYEDGSDKILFIDINVGGTTPGATDVVAAIDARILALP